MRGPIPAIKRTLWKLAPVQMLHSVVKAGRVAKRFALAPPDETPILVYQMAKVGSLTVVRTLESIGLEREVHHVHYMTAAQTRLGIRRHLRAGVRLPYNLLLGRALGEKIRQVDSPQISIITLVRDPVAREVSAVLQVPFFADANLQGGAGLDPTRVLEHLERRFGREGVCLSAEQWFDRELKPTFDIDVFAAPFPRADGYAIYRSRRAKVLLLRMEDLDRVLGPALAEFFDLPEPPKLVRANEPKDSTDSDAYRSVLEKFRLPRDQVDRIYAGRLARHFYPSTTIDEFKERWTRPIR